MKILFVSEHYKHNVQGGGEINLALLCEALAEQGHEVHVLTSFEGTRRIEKMNGVIVYCTVTTGAVDTLLGNLKRSLTFPHSLINEVRQLLQKHAFDVIHLVGSGLQIAPSLKKVTSTPLVATVESFLALCPKGDFLCGDRVDISRWSFLKFAVCLVKSNEIGKLKNKWYIRYNPIFWAFVYRRYIKMRNGLFAVRPIAISRFVQTLLKKFYGIQSRIVPNFVDVDAFRHVKQDVKRIDHKQVVLYLGSLTKYKGAAVLLRALIGLDCTTKIYGDGVLKAQLTEFIEQHHIDAAIYDPVPYTDIPKVYSNSEIVVFPSLWPEPFGRIAIEAMAAGKPVIGSDIGGISETLRDAGVLVKPGDVAQLHSALRKLLEDENLRKRISMKAKKCALVYSKEKVLNQLLGVYNSILQQC